MGKQRTLVRRAPSFSPRKQRGVGVLDVMLGLLVAAIVIKGIVPWLMQTNSTQRVNIAATQAVAFRQGVLSYQQANQAAILAATSPTVGTSRTVAQLIAANALPPNFSAITPYGGTLVASWLQPTAGVLQPIVVATGGATINDGDLADIANAISAQGGEGAYIPSFAATTLTCAMGTCNPIALAPYGYGAMGGHYAIAMFKGTQTSSDDYLHRHNDGVVAHGQMNQSIDLNNNNLNNVNTTNTQVLNVISPTTSWTGVAMQSNGGGHNWLVASTGTAWGAQAGGLMFFDQSAGAERAWFDTTGVFNLNGGPTLNIGGSTFYGDSTNIALRPAANGGTVFVQGPGGGGTGNLNVSGSTTGVDFFANSGWFRSTGNVGWFSQTYGGGIYMIDSSYVRVYADKNFYTGGQGQFGSVQSNGTITAATRITSGEFLLPAGGANPGTGCDTAGLIARNGNGTGTLMNCVNGAWVQIGGGYRNFTIVQGPLQFGFNDSFATCPAGWVMLSGGAEVTVNPYPTLPGVESVPASNTTWASWTTDPRVGTIAFAYCGQ